MDIARLWDILERERRTASLQELPENFCEEVRSYMKRLDEEIKSVDDSRKREILMDERKNARMKIENIVRRRMGKIVKFASSGSKIVPKGMLDDERTAYEVIQKQVEESINKILLSMLGTEDDEDCEEKLTLKK